MTTPDLPPLPEQPEFISALSPNAKAAWHRQMRAYGEACAAAAVLAERERCAKLLERTGNDHCAAAIRAEPKEKT